ncbi:hypothetical protein CN514_00985 [Bacillus sp. AFS001701]|uniref:hypothetical protein n=1 Tax=Bacillus sp. AFS001701 TaxID=2033480 RepID=UPI000BF9773C|nr:hypothetical protein [Bacillus sp. AFS001701]PET77602.1 hypothetical protein CN514_00985 [Bacillus sp. AFS001701]
MKQVYKFDENRIYIEPVLIGDDDPIPLDCTDLELPQPNYKPVFKDGAWVETITEEELEEIQNKPEPKSELEVVKEENAVLKQQVMQTNIDMQEFMDFILTTIQPQ